MNEVWTLKLSPTEATVLALLADAANDEGLCYPSVGLVTWKSNLSERTVQLCLRRLEERRVIEPLGRTGGGRGHTTRYRLCLGRGEKKPAFQPKGEADAPFTSGEGIKGEPPAPFTANGGALKGATDGRKGATGSLKGATDGVKGAADAPEPLRTIKEPSGKLRERGGENGTAARRAPSPVPRPFPLSEEMRRQAESYGVPSEFVDFETDKFIDHFAQSETRKVDWLAAWRNWMRRAKDFGPRPSSNGAAPRPHGRSKAETARTALETFKAEGWGKEE